MRYQIKTGEQMKKYIYFTLGYLTALATIFLASCTVAPLEASSSNCGEESWNPCFVKIVD
tara:strand:- start:58 stop:237 length:180 start_codon:yes stop_codon:yes gene_type:complete